jgi:dihydropteroate synthase
LDQLSVLLKACQFEFVFPRPTLVMGILNVTPDSFSDGGSFVRSGAAVEHARRIVSEGADVLDIGGESTRPGAAPVEEAEELRRVMPVLEQLAGELKIPISIDTMKPGVARAALGAGASIVNNVAANRDDPALWKLIAETGAGYVCLHMQGTPQTMQANPRYQHVVAEVKEFFEERSRRLQDAGVHLDQIIFDPGIGFGKRIEHNLALLKALKEFAPLDRPVLLGVSRKSFLGKISGNDPEPRLASGLACACLAVNAGVQIIRTHDVAETVQAVRTTEAILSSGEV